MLLPPSPGVIHDMDALLLVGYEIVNNGVFGAVTPKLAKLYESELIPIE